MTVDIRLIAILDPAVLGARDPVAAARAAAGGGATMLQLRTKTLAAGPSADLLERLVRAVDVPVYANDRADVAWAAGAAGVHLGADDLPADRLRAVAPPPFGLGVSVGSAGEAARVANAAVDYWSLGSVYATTHKADAGVPIGPEGFRALARRAPAGMPLVAIGGIDVARAAEIVETGADGVAVIGAVFAADHVERATAELRAAVDTALRHR